LKNGSKQIALGHAQSSEKFMVKTAFLRQVKARAVSHTRSWHGK